MRPIWEASGRTNGRPSERREQNEGEVQRSNQFLESSAAMGLSGPRL